MTLNAGIILGGQTPDILGAMDKGRAMAESQINLNRQNALAELYRTQGAQIAAGDQAALNALAQCEPNASLGVQQNRLGIQAQQQDIEFSAEKMQMLRDKSKREATGDFTGTVVSHIQIADSMRAPGGYFSVACTADPIDQEMCAPSSLSFAGRCRAAITMRSR